ncbi:hypothetical protein P9139_17400 [Curtobacterium flaccumfaciens]|nr:hypothetical protein P9139_17400 [Curtobacterium flaccumfaciens]
MPQAAPTWAITVAADFEPPAIAEHRPETAEIPLMFCVKFFRHFGPPDCCVQFGATLLRNDCTEDALIADPL